MLQNVPLKNFREGWMLDKKLIKMYDISWHVTAFFLWFNIA